MNVFNAHLITTSLVIGDGQVHHVAFPFFLGSLGDSCQMFEHDEVDGESRGCWTTYNEDEYGETITLFGIAA